MDFDYPHRFDGRRSAAMSTNGMVATSQPLAARVGLRTLEDGGNAADAAIATAATLAVVEPAMTGIGGDAFALASFDDVVGLNGSGGAPSAASLETYRDRTDVTEDGEPAMPETGGLPVTVPGALDAWERLLGRFGTRTLGDVLRPAITYAREGFPVSEVVADEWAGAAERLRPYDEAVETFLPGGEPLEPGQRFANPTLAETYETIAREGAGSFYGGDIGADVVTAVRDAGGTLSLADLERHEGEWTDPISTTYRGVEVLEHPPNGQGAIALEALNVADALDPPGDPADPDRWHRLIEATKVGFADGHAYVSDPDRVDVPLDTMLSKRYAEERAADVTREAGTYQPSARGDLDSDTVYLSVIDGDGNAVSFINSIYYPFGSGVVARGFALQNRGHSFSLDPDHANALAPDKRPFHTIIPAMLREEGEVRASWGVMGGQMQPQGHVQVVSNLVDRGLNPQAALDAPRYRWLADRRVAIETERVPQGVVDDLRARGHEVVDESTYVEAGGHWGGGQVIYREEDGTLLGGSDPRKDGVAIGF